MQRFQFCGSCDPLTGRRHCRISRARPACRRARSTATSRASFMRGLPCRRRGRANMTSAAKRQSLASPPSAGITSSSAPRTSSRSWPRRPDRPRCLPSGATTAQLWSGWRGPHLTTTSIGLGSTFPLLDSATGRVFLAYLPRQQLVPRLQLEINRAATCGISWPDLNPDLDSVEALIARIRRERIAYVEGRYIPGLIAISSAITNWQGEIEVTVTLFGTHKEMTEPGSSARSALLDFASRHSIVATTQLSRGVRGQ